MIILIQHTLGHGGASDSFRRIRRTLVKKNKTVLSYSFFGCNDTSQLFKKRSYTKRIIDKVQFNAATKFQSPLNTLLPAARENLSQAKLVILFNLHGGSTSIYDLKTIRNSTTAEITFRASDIYWLTGRCAFPSECTKYQRDCAVCNFLDEYPIGKNPALKSARSQKLQIFSESIDTILAPSHWIREEFKRVYSDKEIILGRNALNIPSKTTLSDLPPNKSILFCASSLSDYRKGFHLFLDMLRLNIKYLRNVTIHIVGAFDGDILSKYPFLSELAFLKIHGRVDKATLIEIFQEVDLYVHLALADNFPNTILTAHYLGIPTLALDRGGVNELAKLHDSGICLRSGNPIEICTAIKTYFIEKEHYKANALKLQQRLPDYCNEDKALMDLLRKVGA